MGTRLLALLAAGVVAGLTAAPAVAADQRITLGAVQSSSGTVSAIAAVDPLPVPALGPADVSASSGGSPLPVQSASVLPGTATVALVVDASADGAAALDDDGRSGAAGFLLQLPPAATTVVVADRRPAAVVAGPVTGVARGLTAVSGLRNTGVRDTPAALDLAVGRLPVWPAAQPVIVLFTGAADAGGLSAGELSARLLGAHAVLAVVTTAASDTYWAQVAGATGGLALRTTPAKAITAFDRVADGLKARYAVTVPRPPAGGPIDLTMGSATVTVTPPTLRAGEPQAIDARDDEGGGLGQYVGPLLIVLLVLGAIVLVVAVIVTRAGRPAAGRAADPAPGPELTPPAREVAPGVRVWEGADLFEPRSVRDAREGTDLPDQPQPPQPQPPPQPPRPEPPQPPRASDLAGRRLPPGVTEPAPPPQRVRDHGIPAQGRTAREVAEGAGLAEPPPGEEP
jgi:hypothetical protein